MLRKLQQLPFMTLCIFGISVAGTLNSHTSLSLASLVVELAILFPPQNIPAVLLTHRWLQLQRAHLLEKLNSCYETVPQDIMSRAIARIDLSIASKSIRIGFWKWSLASSVKLRSADCQTLDIFILATAPTRSLFEKLLHECGHIVEGEIIRSKSRRDIFIEELSGELTAIQDQQIERCVRECTDPKDGIKGLWARWEMMMIELLWKIFKGLFG